MRGWWWRPQGLPWLALSCQSPPKQQEKRFPQGHTPPATGCTLVLITLCQISSTASATISYFAVGSPDPWDEIVPVCAVGAIPLGPPARHGGGYRRSTAWSRSSSSELAMLQPKEALLILFCLTARCVTARAENGGDSLGQAAPAGQWLHSPFRCRRDAPPEGGPGPARPGPSSPVGAGGEAPRHRRCRFPPLSCRFPRRRRLRTGLDRHAKAAAG